MDYNLQLTGEVLESVLIEQREDFLAKDSGIEREILGEIKGTINSSLISVITGLRRVGKSTLLLQISRKYLKDDFFFVNFEDERFINFNVMDFDYLHETLTKLFGEKKIFLFDEIQNIPEWERYVRRMSDKGYKFIITGSNASLLSSELGTRLTGRSVRIELFPFSFQEFKEYKKFPLDVNKPLTAIHRGRLLKLINEYILKGGIPDALKYPELEIYKSLYEDIIYRDIASRYQIENIKSLKELSLFLVSNTASLVSFNKLKELLKIGSVNTVKNFIEYLENSWLFFVVNKYAYSVKEQQIANKKIYCIDTGLTASVGFSFSENKGRALENTVFLDLRRKTDEIFYYKTGDGYEVDFYLPREKMFIQVTSNLDSDQTREREFRALLDASSEVKKAKLFIVTENQKELIKTKNFPDIIVTPLYDWLLKKV